MIEVRQTLNKGRGVFALMDFGPGGLITADPVVEVSAEDLSHLLQTPLKSYWFHWPCNGKSAVAFGPVSMMNHSDSPNAQFSPDYRKRLMVVRAVRPIAAGDEITVHYGRNPVFPAGTGPLGQSNVDPSCTVESSYITEFVGLV